MTQTPQPPQGQGPAPQQPAYQAPQPQYPAPQPAYQQPGAAPTAGKGLQVAGMVLGILSLVLFWLPFGDLACGIIGLSLSAAGLKKASAVGGPKGMGIAGLVCSIIGTVWGIVHVIIFFVVLQEATRIRRVYHYRYCLPPLDRLFRF